MRMGSLKRGVKPRELAETRRQENGATTMQKQEKKIKTAEVALFPVARWRETYVHMQDAGKRSRGFGRKGQCMIHQVHRKPLQRTAVARYLAGLTVNSSGWGCKSGEAGSTVHGPQPCLLAHPRYSFFSYRGGIRVTEAPQWRMPPL